VLNKSVCKKCMSIEPCYTGHNPPQWREPIPWRYVTDEYESTNDEKNWSKGIVHCPLTLMEHEIKEIPKHCPYELEHIIATQ
jgi:hypothetical protein